MAVYTHATSIRTNYSGGTDATWRDFLTFWANSFTSCGWTRTADTGQIDLATTLNPTSTNLNRGYMIFAMGDALQATNPFFVKIEFGSGVVTGAPFTAFTVGAGTDGAGTINLRPSVRQTIQWLSYSAALLPASAAGDGSYLNVCCQEQAGNVFGFLSIDRSRNPTTGAATGDGVGVTFNSVAVNSTNHASTYSYGFAADAPTELPYRAWTFGPPPVIPYHNAAGTGIAGNDIKTAGSFGYLYPDLHPTNAMYALFNDDTPDYQTFSMTTMGAAHTYRVLPYANGGSIMRYANELSGGPNPYAFDLAVRWE